MRLFVILTFLITSGTAQAQVVTNYFKAKDSAIESVEIFPCEDYPSIIAVIYEWQKDWWGSLAVIKKQGNSVLWEATISSLPQEQSIRRIKGLKLKGHTNLFFEVYGQTHMGNGDYYLYELRGKRLFLIAQTRAVDNYLDNSPLIKGSLQFYNRTFKGDILKATYRDIDQDGNVDIELKGTILITDNNDHLAKSYSCRKVLLYSKTHNKFIEDIRRRVGFDRNYD